MLYNFFQDNDNNNNSNAWNCAHPEKGSGPRRQNVEKLTKSIYNNNHNKRDNHNNHSNNHHHHHNHHHNDNDHNGLRKTLSIK